MRAKDTSGLSDIPAEEDDQGLGLASVADALTDFISKCANPLTIGLQGDWGSGKTSLMKFIQKRLKKDVEHVWFNTWEYSQFHREDQLPVSLMLNLTRQLQRKAMDFESASRGNKPNKAKFFDSLRRFGKVASKIANAYVSNATGGLVDSRHLAEMFETDDETMDEAQVVGSIKARFESLVDEFLSLTDATRLVVFIDDLDRLRPTRAIEVLEVIKNFLDVSGCVFVLAIDYDVIVAGLAERKGYQLMPGEGKSFFDKIIQVPFRMPIGRYHAEAFIARRLVGAGLCGNRMRTFWLGPTPKGNSSQYQPEAALGLLVRHSVGPNPRSIKRMLNLLTLHALLVKKTRDGKKEDTDAHHTVLLPLAALQMACHPAYEFVVQASKDDIDLALIALANIGSMATEGEEHDVATWLDEVMESKLKTLDRTTPDRTWDVSLGEHAARIGPWLRKAARLRMRLERPDHGYDQHRFSDLEILAELLFRAIDFAVSQKENGVLSREERDNAFETFQVANVTQSGESSINERSGAVWTREEFVEELRRELPERADAVEHMLSGLAAMVGSGLIQLRWGTGRNGTLHVCAAPSFKKFLTMKTNGVIQVSFQQSGLDPARQAKANAELQELLGGTEPAANGRWLRLAGPGDDVLWKHDPNLDGLLTFARAFCELARDENQPRSLAPTQTPPQASEVPVAHGAAVE